MASGDTRPIERVGRFRIIGRIARGGMAEIFLARPEDPEATDAGAEVALKRLLPELRRNREFTDMFRDEANLASRLDHPNIVRILEVGQDPGDPQAAKTDHEVPFIAMELLRGVNLRDLLARLQTLRRSMPVDLGVFVALGALRGLSHAHTFTDSTGRPLRIVHRDVSPQNVILTYDGAVKLVDFGVAKAEGRLHQTRAGLIKGKFAYMSPEQVDGAELDGRSDLFALAEVFYELLLRRHPFYAASDMDVLRKILDEDPPDPRELEPEFPAGPAESLLRALRKNPEDRFEDAEAMRTDLSDWLMSQRRRPTSVELATFVRELFSDRRHEEEAARQRGDDKALVDALRVGRAAQVGMMVADPPRSGPAQHALRPSPLESDVADALPTMVFDSAAAASRARSEPKEGDGGRGSFPAPGAGARNRPQGRPSRPESVRVEPADAQAFGPKVAPSAHLGPPDTRIAPAERAAAVVDPAEPGSRPQDERIPSGTAPGGLEAGSEKEKEASRTGPRTPTVRRGRGERPAKTARFDLAVFAVGLVALTGAIVFALEPFEEKSRSVEVRSDPPEARILIDGKESGRLSPSRLRLPIGGVHDVELRKKGFKPCQRRVSTKLTSAPEAVDCVLQPIAPRKP